MNNNKSSPCFENIRSLKECIQSCFLRRISLKRDTSAPLSNVQTSTQDLVFQNTSEHNKIYNSALRKAILQWSENLPVYQNEKFEELKQNIINEFIDKINEIRFSADDDKYDSKLRSEIDNFVDPLPTYTEAQSSEASKNNLKKHLYNIINKINDNQVNNITNKRIVDSKLKHDQKSNMTNSKSSIYEKNYNNIKPCVSNTATSNTQIFNGKCISDITQIANNSDQIMATAVDAETQDNVSAIPYYNEVYGYQPKLEDSNTNTKYEELYKQEIDKQLKHIFDINDLSSSRRERLVDNLLNNLKPLLLYKNVNALNYKISLKSEIYKFVNNLLMMEIDKNDININNLFTLVDDLTNRLLYIKINEAGLEQNLYYLNFTKNCNDLMKFNLDLNNYSLSRSLIYQIVSDKLNEANIYNSDIIVEIINKIYNNISPSGFICSPDLKNELFKIINDSTDLSDVIISTIIDWILRQIQYYNSVNIATRNVDNKSFLPVSVVIYKSEDKISKPQFLTRVLDTPCSSNCLESSSGDIISREKSYLAKLSNVIKSWILNISDKLKKPYFDEVKYDEVKNLATDLLDQKKIEQNYPETGAEKRKYMNFLILRWLINTEYFKDLSDAKPYVEILIEQICSIDTPVFVKTEPQDTLQLQEESSHIHLVENKTSYSELHQINNFVSECPNSCCYTSLASGTSERSRVEPTVDSIGERSNYVVKFNKSDRITKGLEDKITKNMYRIENELNENQFDNFPNEIRKNIFGNSQLNGSINRENIINIVTTSSMPNCCQNIFFPPKTPAELILDIVEFWCEQILFTETDEENKGIVNTLKDSFIIKIITKISELNMNPETFNDDTLFEILLDKELENILNTLPESNKFLQIKDIKKRQLINAIRTVKPIIKLENARYEYKQKLKMTIANVIGHPNTENLDKMAKYIDLRDKIIDHFIKFNLFRDDMLRQKFHQTKIYDSMVTYYKNIDKNGGTLLETDLMGKFEKLLCELNKVPSPDTESTKEGKKEFHVKTLLHKLFDEFPCSTSMKNKIEYALARRLSDIEKEGYTNQNMNRIKKEVIDTFENFGVVIDAGKIKEIVEELEIIEASRRSSFSENYKHSDCKNPELTEEPIIKDQQNKDMDDEFSTNNNRTKMDKSQWISLLPATPMRSNLNYESFERNIHLSSSIIRNSPDSKDQFLTRNMEKKFDDIRNGNVTRRSMNFPKIDKDKWYSLPSTTSNEQDSNIQPDLQGDIIISVRQQPHPDIDSHSFNQSQIQENFNLSSKAKRKDETSKESFYSNTGVNRDLSKGPSKGIANVEPFTNVIGRNVPNSNKRQNEQSSTIHPPMLNVIQENIPDSDQSQVQTLTHESEAYLDKTRNGCSYNDQNSRLDDEQRFVYSDVVEPDKKDVTGFNQIQSEQYLKFPQSRFEYNNNKIQNLISDSGLKQNQQLSKGQKSYHKDANIEFDNDKKDQKEEINIEQQKYNSSNYTHNQTENRRENSNYNKRASQLDTGFQLAGFSAKEIEPYMQISESDLMQTKLKQHTGFVDQNETRNIYDPNLRVPQQESRHQELQRNILESEPDQRYIYDPNLRVTQQESRHQELQRNNLESEPDQRLNRIQIKCRSSFSPSQSVPEYTKNRVQESRIKSKRQNYLSDQISSQANPCQRRIFSKKCGSSCRRPSISIFNPEESCNSSHFIRYRDIKDTDNENDRDEESVCKRRKDRVCKATLPSCPIQLPLCKICNKSQPFCSGASRKRYPSYYYC